MTLCHDFALPDSFRVDASVFDGVDVVTVEGEVDLLTSYALDEPLDRLRDRPVVVDLCGCTFMDCSGLHALLRALGRAEIAGGDVVIACPPTGPCSRLLRLAVGDRFATFESRKPAVAALSASRRTEESGHAVPDSSADLGA